MSRVSMQRRLFATSSVLRAAPTPGKAPVAGAGAVPLAGARYKRTKLSSMGPVNIPRGENHTVWSEKPGPSRMDERSLVTDLKATKEGTLYLLDKSALSRLTGVFGLQKRMEYDFSFSSEPTTVVLNSTAKLLATLQSQSGDSTPAYLIRGSSGVGKSYSLLQVSLHALKNDWIVLYLPECLQLVNSASSYVYSPSKSIYLQPDLSQKVLRALFTANEKLLSKLPFEASNPSGPSIASVLKNQLRERGAMEDMSTTMLEDGQEDPKHLEPGDLLHKTMQSLSSQSSYPVLIALDGVNAIFRSSKYKDPENQLIDSWGLEVPRLLLDYLSGTRSFKRGLVMSAISTHPTEWRSLDLESITSTPRTLRHRELNRKYYQVLAQNLKPVDLKERLSETEARGLYSMWVALKGVNRARDSLFLEKYIESDGNPKMFERSLRDSLGL